MARSGLCAVCGRPFRRAEVGRPRITCGDACRQAMKRGRLLGDGPLSEVGYGPENVLAMVLRATRPDPVALRVIDAMYAAHSRRQ
jgi:hypothetical protein